MKYHLTVIVLFVLSIQGFAQQHHNHSNSGAGQSSKNIFLKTMDSMMTDMTNIPSAKSTDEDFLLQMIPHHLGAIEMARYEIANGKNFEMIQLAKSILAEQQIEVHQMPVLIRQLTAKEDNITPVYSEEMNEIMLVMMKDLPVIDTLTDTDKAFAGVMLPHHQAAIDMARLILKSGTDLQTRAFATMLISNEQIEIQQMSIYLQKL